MAEIAKVSMTLGADIAKLIVFVLKNFHPGHNLGRTKVIRTLCHACRQAYPNYNVVVFELGHVIMYIQLDDIIYEQEHEMQDLIGMFKFKILLFEKGEISILKGVKDATKWGI